MYMCIVHVITYHMYCMYVYQVHINMFEPYLISLGANQYYITIWCSKINKYCDKSKLTSTQASLLCCSYRGLPLGVLSINFWILNLWCLKIHAKLIQGVLSQYLFKMLGQNRKDCSMVDYAHFQGYALSWYQIKKPYTCIDWRHLCF